MSNKKTLSEMTQQEADTIFTLCTTNKWGRENLNESKRSTVFEVDEDGDVEIRWSGDILFVSKENIYGWEYDPYADDRDMPINYVGIKYIMDNFDVDMGADNE